jgi:hypothetical protein
MRLYQTTGTDSVNSAERVIWNGSAADASKQRTAFKKDGYKGVSTEEYDVPTNKTALLDFLNANKVMVSA